MQHAGSASPHHRSAAERVRVIDVDATRHRQQPIALVNPEIVLQEGSARGEEGCLSIPEVYGDVDRAARVVVRALDPMASPSRSKARDLLARCLQHEIDHLHGKLFIDYLSIFKRRAALSKWEEEKAKYPALIRTVVPAAVIADGTMTPRSHESRGHAAISHRTPARPPRSRCETSSSGAHPIRRAVAARPARRRLRRRRASSRSPIAAGALALASRPVAGQGDRDR